MIYGLVIGLTIIATLAAVGYVQRRDVDTDWLTDVEPVVAPAEPRPDWLPLPAERRAHWRPGTTAYDTENAIRKTWGELHGH